MKKILSFLISLTVLFTIFSNFITRIRANESYDYTYKEVSERGYVVDTSQGIQTVTFKLVDLENNPLYAYCVDYDTFIVKNSLYSRVNVDDAAYYSEENANKIRAIIQNSYPFISLSQVSSLSNISNLTKEDAITATQLAVWKYSNNKTFCCQNAKVTALYNWLLSLEPVQAVNTPVAKIEITQESFVTNNKVKQLFYYRADEKNIDGSEIDLAYSFNKDLSTTYGAIVEDKGINQGGYHVLSVANLPLDANFSLMIKGKQNLSFDAYFYAPEKGKDSSQSLVGGYVGSTNISKSTSFSLIQPKCGYVTLEKIDSITLQGLANATFKIGNNQNFDDLVYTGNTDSNGFLTFNSLTSGTWYIKEVTAPNGYIPQSEIFTITVGKNPVNVQIKNTAYGNIEIILQDIANQAISGGVFDVYDEDNNLVYDDLATDLDGTIDIFNVLPGSYTIYQISTANGFVIDPNPQTITVLSKETATALFINERIPITAENYGMYVVIGGFVLAAGVIIIVFAAKKKNEK